MDQIPTNERSELIRKIKSICFSNLGKDGILANSADYDRFFGDQTIELHTMFAPDFCGAHNGVVSVDYEGKNVFYFDVIQGEVRKYSPGNWIGYIDSLHKQVA